MTRRFAPPAIVLCLITLGLVMPTAAEAQGQGRPKNPSAHGNAPFTGTTTTTTTTPTTTTTSTGSGSPIVDTSVASSPLGTAAIGFRQFGSWLDDATAVGPGDGYTTISAGQWRMLGSTQTNFPMISGGVGITDRLQASATVPFYHATYQGTTASGLDDVYLSAKYVLADPTLTVSEVGFAVSPVVEILGSDYGLPGGRVHFAIPVSVEVRRAPYRVYASGGYFTRGSVFSGAALEWTASSGTVFTGNITQSYSTKQDPTLDALGIARTRADVSGSVAHPFTSTLVVFGTVGRSLTSIEQGGTKLAVSGGVSLRFNAPIGTR
jgi:hypothetical protein